MDNGLGHTPTGGFPEFVSEGSKAFVRVDPGYVFPVFLTPTASSTTTGGFPSIVGELEIEMFVEVDDVRIQVDGSISSTPAKTNILPGQVCLSKVLCGPYSQSDHDWETAGAVLYDAHHIEWGSTGTGPLGSYIDSREAVDWTPSQQTAPQFQFLVEEDGELILTCSLKIYDGAVFVGNAQAEVTVDSWAPYYEYRWSMGDTVYDPKSITNPDYVKASEAPSFLAVGAYFDAKVGTPAFFQSTLGYGRFDFTQLVDFYRQYKVATGPWFTRESGFMDLDHTYPYAVGGIADSVEGTPSPYGSANDSPDLELLNATFNFTIWYVINHEFWMFLTWTPPSHPLGVNTEDIALHFVEWRMTGDDQRSYNGNWSNIYPPGGVWKTIDYAFNAWRYTWDDVLLLP